MDIAGSMKNLLEHFNCLNVSLKWGKRFFRLLKLKNNCSLKGCLRNLN